MMKSTLVETSMILTALKTNWEFYKTNQARRRRYRFVVITDGLRAEREQGLPLMLYKYFSTSKRKFIIADAPGHENNIPEI